MIPKPLSSPTDTILVTGSGGLLGSELVDALGARAGCRVIGVGHAQVEIADPGSVAAFLDETRPTVLVNAAGYTAVDRAESERALAYRGNVTGPKVLAEACSARGVKLIHYSTDQVFDGRKGRPYREEDPVGPLNYYAVTKEEGEREALRAPRALVLRVQWLYGRLRDRFTPLAGMQSYGMFIDQFGAPTWAGDIARWTLELLRRDSSGVFHAVYDDYASWAEIFEFVKAECGYTVKLVPGRTADAGLPAARPEFSVLANAKLRAELGVETLGGWRKPLARFLAEKRRDGG